jgi:hypothetical protein
VCAAIAQSHDGLSRPGHGPEWAPAVDRANGAATGSLEK